MRETANTRPQASLLTPEENEAVEHLASAWNAWMKLESLHPNATIEFNRLVHAAQYMVMARPVQRQFNTATHEDIETTYPH